MAAKSEPVKAAGMAVRVPFAYATSLDGQVVQLVKGDVVDAAKYTKESVGHLRSIGFIG